MRLDLHLASLLVLVHHVLAQAPGDRDVLCVDPGSSFFIPRPNYPPSLRVLLDSRDYENLLQGPGPSPASAAAWQQVDNDNNNTMSSATTPTSVSHSEQRSYTLPCTCSYKPQLCPLLWS